MLREGKKAPRFISSLRSFAFLRREKKSVAWTSKKKTRITPVELGELSRIRCVVKSQPLALYVYSLAGGGVCTYQYICRRRL